MKIAMMLIGILLLVLGLFLTFGIIVYSLKENDNAGFYYLILSLGFVTLGIYCLVKNIRKK